MSTPAERLWAHALDCMRELQEPFALTEATRSRSTSRRKTGAQRAREHAYLRGLCRALDYLGVMPEHGAYIALRNQVLAERRPQEDSR